MPCFNPGQVPSRLLLLFVATFFSVPTLAIDLGTYGMTNKIIEPDLLVQIDAKLKGLQAQGLLDKYQQQFIDKARKRIKRPIPAFNVTDTVTPRDFIYDPTYTAPQDYKDHNGVVFVKKGFKVNPLATVNIRPMLFFNGDNARQSTWALEQYKQHQGNLKLILTRGSPLALMQEWNIRVYFDQHGSITKKLGITQVPAIVKQTGLVLKIKELKLIEVEDE